MDPFSSADRSPIDSTAVRSELDRCEQELVELYCAMSSLEAEFHARIESIEDERRRASARNLLHYVALRRHDLRDLQDRLAAQGFSSLGRCESHVVANVISVLKLIAAVRQRPAAVEPSDELLAMAASRELLRQRTERLLGTPRPGRSVRVMVTMSAEAADDPGMVRQLIQAGMDCARINCAHDSPAVWERIVRNVRDAAREEGTGCRVLMDLGGPKLRTGAINPGAEVLRFRPERDEFGRVQNPARIVFVPERQYAVSKPIPGAVVLPVDAQWLDSLQLDDVVRLWDCRGRLRRLIVVKRDREIVSAQCDRTAYVATGTALEVHTIDGNRTTRVGRLPAREQRIRLGLGEVLMLHNDPTHGEPALYDGHGHLVKPASIGCTLAEVFSDVKPGERLLIDDGRLTTVIREVHHDHLLLEVVRATAGRVTLRGDKGINLPDTDLRLPALTAKDREDLQFVVDHADLVGYSFVRRAEDVRELQSAMSAMSGDHLGVILKIENRQAFAGLPALLLAALRSPSTGLMIARGDLAVECGYERLAEVQEELLWMAEAAHLPVVWATQVLENLAKQGIPSRAEITDAAMGVRAECVMLNKGPHIVQAVSTLDDILRRMEQHQHKKRSMFRRLSVAGEMDERGHLE